MFRSTGRRRLDEEDIKMEMDDAIISKSVHILYEPLNVLHKYIHVCSHLYNNTSIETKSILLF